MRLWPAGRMRLAIVGGGPSGLIAFHVVRKFPDLFENVVLFEASDRLGGIWADGEKSWKKRGPVYQDLRANLPCRLMEVPGVPFHVPQEDAASGSSFVHHAEVSRYLKEFFDVDEMPQWVVD